MSADRRRRPTTSSSSVEASAATPAPCARPSWACPSPSSRRASSGGTCLHVGCIPTKALLHAAEVADVAREGERFGVRATLESVDMPGVNAYKDGVVGRLHKGLQGLVKSAAIDYVEGAGRLDGRRTVVVGDRRLDRHERRARHRRRTPSTLPGLEIGGPRHDERAGAALDHVPARVVVLGGGVIGVEFASVFGRSASEVTIVEALPRLVAAEDEALGKQLERAFRKRKIAFKTGVRFAGASAGRRRRDRLASRGATTIEADLLLVAVGRGPVTDGLGYEEAGVTLDRGFVPTDERLPHQRRRRLCRRRHRARPPARPPRASPRASSSPRRSPDCTPAPIVESGIPRVTYCDPEIASVGLTEAQAREQHGEVETYEYNLGGNGKSQILRHPGLRQARAGEGRTRSSACT